MPGNNYVALVATATIRLLTKASVKSMVDLIKSKGVIVNEPLEVYLQRIFGDANYFKKYCDYLKKPHIGWVNLLFKKMWNIFNTTFDKSTLSFLYIISNCMYEYTIINPKESKGDICEN